MPDGLSPEIKISRNPQTQARVENVRDSLQQKFPEASEQHLNFQARSKVANEMMMRIVRRMLGKKAQNAEQRAEIAEENSMTDALTGLKSRRWYDEQLATKMAALQRHSSENQGFYLALYDLDNLRQWNDHFGYSGANEVLKNVKKIGTRPGEDIARIGGDEFAQLINSGTNEEEILTIVRRNADSFHQSGEETIPGLSLKEGRPTNSQPPTESTFSVGMIRVTPGMTLEGIQKLQETAIAKAKLQKDSIAISRDGVTVELVPRHAEPTPQPVQI